MSIQSDCELLAIQAMEEYAKKNHVLNSVAIEIFHNNQANSFKFI